MNALLITWSLGFAARTLCRSLGTQHLLVAVLVLERIAIAAERTHPQTQRARIKVGLHRGSLALVLAFFSGPSVTGRAFDDGFGAF